MNTASAELSSPSLAPLAEPVDSGLGSTIVIAGATTFLGAVSMLVIWTQIEPVITLVSRAVH